MVLYDWTLCPLCGEEMQGECSFCEGLYCESCEGSCCQPQTNLVELLAFAPIGDEMSVNSCATSQLGEGGLLE